MKIGLDDYLCKHSIEEVKQLPVYTPEQMETVIEESRRKRLTEKIEKATIENYKELLCEIAACDEVLKNHLTILISNKLGVRDWAVGREIKSIVNKIEAERLKKAWENEGGEKNSRNGKEPIISAHFPNHVDVATCEDGGVAYLIVNNNSLEVVSEYEVDGVLHQPPDKQHLPFLLPRADKVITWYNSDNDEKLFVDVIAYLKRFSYLSDGQWLIVAINVFLSYIQDNTDIHYIPMLLFFAVPERGKSRTGKSATYISFRGIHLVDLREANLFRYSQNLRATLFFDLMNLWKKAEKNGAEDILLLRYEKGAKAARVIFPEKGAFQDTVHYDIFGSTLIATNEAVHKILDTRCINITMPNKPGNYENPTPEMGLELKERLTAWRARMMYKPLPVLDVIEGLGGRLWDITKPLLQVCKLVYPPGFEDLKTALLEIAVSRTEDKKTSIEGKIIWTLHELSPKGLTKWRIDTSELLEKLNKDRPDKHKFTSQYVGKRLKAIGIETKSIGGFSRIFLNRNEWDTLLEQYDMCEKTLPNPTKLQNFEKSLNLVESGRVSGDMRENISWGDTEAELFESEVTI